MSFGIIEYKYRPMNHCYPKFPVKLGKQGSKVKISPKILATRVLNASFPELNFHMSILIANLNHVRNRATTQVMNESLQTVTDSSHN